MFIVKDPLSYLNHHKPVGSGQCVAFGALGADPNTGSPLDDDTTCWRAGLQVANHVLPVGTVIAVFGPTGRFLSREGSGDAHVAIYLRQSDIGVEVLHQYRGKPVYRSVIAWGGYSVVPSRYNTGMSPSADLHFFTRGKKQIAAHPTGIARETMGWHYFVVEKTEKPRIYTPEQVPKELPVDKLGWSYQKPDNHR